MEFLHRSRELIDAHVSVPLSRLKRLVTEQLLKSSQVRTARKKMRREAMPKRVRM